MHLELFESEAWLDRQNRVYEAQGHGSFFDQHHPHLLPGMKFVSIVVTFATIFVFLASNTMAAPVVSKSDAVVPSTLGSDTVIVPSVLTNASVSSDTPHQEEEQGIVIFNRGDTDLKEVYANLG